MYICEVFLGNCTMRGIFIGILVIITTLSANAQAVDGASNANTVKWYTLEEAQALNAKAPRKIFMDIYTFWCGWCKVLDKNTFSNPKVVEYLNTFFYPVKFNAEGKDPVIFNNYTFNYNAEYKCNDLVIGILRGNLSYPSMVFIDEKLQLLTLLQGYVAPDVFFPILIFFAYNYYQMLGWEDFQQQLPEIMRKLK